MTRAPEPDQRTMKAAQAVERLATLLPQARQHVRSELALLDSHRNQHPGAAVQEKLERRSDPIGGKCGGTIISPSDPDELVTCGRLRPCAEHDAPVHLTAVERAVEARMALQRRLADIEAADRLLAVAAFGAVKDCIDLIGTRLEVELPECRDGQAGKDGTIEWGDTTCQEPEHKAGLCNRHYMAWYRWRREHNVDTAKMFEPGRAVVL